MSHVALEGVTKKYGSVTAVDALDLSVGDKELLVLVGPSGCGKSTVLRLIAGLEEPTSGRIRIGGQVVNDVPPKERDIAMVFQNYALYPHMSVARNLAFGLRMRGLPKREIVSRVHRTASVLGIDALLDRKPGQLSGGQRQRVAVGRAIVRDPAVFLLDEPLSNLDAKLRVAMRAELVKLHRQLETTMIYVTHDQVEAMTMGERIVVMKDGRKQQTGSPRDVYDAPVNRFVAEFIGNPPMNFLEGKLVAGDRCVSVAIGNARLALPSEDSARYAAHAGKPVLFGIRPEDVRLTEPDEHEGHWQRLGARIGVTQHLGADTILELHCEGQTVQARANPRAGYAPNTALHVHVNMSRCRLFDYDTEQAI